jgi:transposase
VPPEEPGPPSSLEPYREFVSEKRAQGVQMTALWQLLRERGYAGSYSAVRRFVGRLEPRRRETFLRVETAAGEEAQVDFGYVGELHDRVAGRLRKAWVFVMTLAFSRHQYAEIVFDQKVATWVALHVRAFEAFGGVVRRVVLDNLRAGIVKAVVHDAEAQRSYRELAEHYGFLIAPCRPRTPRHKGKVEAGVRYIKRNALAGRSFADLHEANAHLARWVGQVAGVRDHGTTHEPPLTRFAAERPALLPLPATRYEIIVWQRARLHPDCHLVFDWSFYSAPHRLVGEHLWGRATPGRVEVYREHERVATHVRAAQRGTRRTIADHLPPDKLQGLLPQATLLRAQAARIGAAAAALIDRLLGERPLDRVRTAQGVLRLERRYGPGRLEAACRRALAFNEPRYHTVKHILLRGLDREPFPDAALSGPLPKTARFARSIAELFPALSR